MDTGSDCPLADAHLSRLKRSEFDLAPESWTNLKGVK